MSAEVRNERVSVRKAEETVRRTMGGAANLFDNQGAVMSNDRPTSVPHAARWAKRAISISLLVVLLGTLAVPVPAFARGHSSGSSLPTHFARPLDGVGDSPLVP